MRGAAKPVFEHAFPCCSGMTGETVSGSGWNLNCSVAWLWTDFSEAVAGILDGRIGATVIRRKTFERNDGRVNSGASGQPYCGALVVRSL